MPTFLFARPEGLEQDWPFVPARLVERLAQLGEVRVLTTRSDMPLSEQAPLGDVDAIALLAGSHLLTQACVVAAPRLRALGGVWDNSGGRLPVEALFERQIPLIDATRAWGQSVAETALGLALGALRQIPQWHCQMARGEPLWEYAYGQFCDNPDFVNGDLGTKQVGVIGLGAIGSRVARWCAALGSTVRGFDPFLPEATVRGWGVVPVALDRLVDESEVVFVLVPPTPSAKHLLNRDRIARLRNGSLVVAVTRAHAIDMNALRERILADELAGAFDVYDVEPLPPDDPLRGRANVVHTPHIAGRTRDANLRVADLIADDFARILRGEPPQAALTPEAIRVRTEAVPVPGAEGGR
jgi:phosphoglycerate dehydrogenase-like enzyme